ncbi:MAG: hypothetical protein ACRD27_10260 [Terracidiphilus sp.]
MRVRFYFLPATLLCGVALFAAPSRLVSQSSAQAPGTGTAAIAASEVAIAALPEAPAPQTPASTSSSQQTPAAPNQTGQKQAQSSTPAPALKPQPKRILGIMPNYRAVSAGAVPPPPTPKEAFKIATENSFDYSAFVFTGITSLLAEGSNSHPQLGKGVDGYWGYYWRGFVDKTDGNYMVDFVMPTIFHQDERYYAMGKGSILKRGIYAASRELITPNYHGRNTFNASEILGRGVAETISLAYYPSETRTLGGFSEKYGYAVGRDALTNVFREFWPDINSHLFHHRHRT